MKTYRVVQWATGNIGSRALQAVIEHPTLELAGVYVHTSAKAGRDAGELCGLDPTGVVTTNDIEEVVALGADCVRVRGRAGHPHDPRPPPDHRQPGLTRGNGERRPEPEATANDHRSPLPRAGGDVRHCLDIPMSRRVAARSE